MERDELTRSQRFAFYTTIPILVIQVLLLACSVGTLFKASPRRAGHEDLEKDAHPLRNVHSSHSHATRQGVSFDTKSERSYMDGGRAYAAKA